jgi:hypothetical protein
VTTTATTKLKAPKITSAKNKKGKKVLVKYKKVAGAAGYQIAYSTKASMSGKRTVNSRKTSFTLKGLKKGKIYYIRVRAYQVVDGVRVYSAYSTKKKVKIKK